MDVQRWKVGKVGLMSQERLKIHVKLLLNVNRKSYMSHRLAQQRMSLNDLEWPFHASRAISAVAELFVYSCDQRFYIYDLWTLTQFGS